MRFNKSLLLGIIAFLLVVVVTVSLVVLPRKTEIRTKAGQEEKALVFFVPGEAVVKSGETIGLDLKIDTGQVVCGGVDLTVNYDPTVLNLVAPPVGGSVLDSVTSRENRGVIEIHGEGEFIGQGTVAELVFSGRGFGETTVSFSGETVIWNEGQTGNILKKTVEAVVVVD